MKSNKNNGYVPAAAEGYSQK